MPLKKNLQAGLAHVAALRVTGLMVTGLLCTTAMIFLGRASMPAAAATQDPAVAATQDPAVAATQDPAVAATQELAWSPAAFDPAKMVLPERCGECHWSEHLVWQQTDHATGFDTMHRKESAESIAAAMGYRLVKRDSLCLECHYTPIYSRGQTRAGAGVSCESCHGPASDWVNIHNDYGVRERDFQVARGLETPEHREERIARARAAGMRRPSDLYDTLASCYRCHTVPQEKLVNVGDHSTGSLDFEIVNWTQGAARHNFLESFLTGDGTANAESPPARKRLMFAVARALELEYDYRALAVATDPAGRFYRSGQRRARLAVGELREIAARVRSSEIDEILKVAAALDTATVNPAEWLAAADAVQAQARRLAASDAGPTMAALDPLYQDPDAPRVAVAEPPPSAESPAIAQAADETPAAGVPAAAAPVSADAPVSLVSDVPVAADAPVEMVGEIVRRSPWFPAASHETLRPGTCSACHGKQDAWWFDDPHFASADPFMLREPANVAISVNYGIGADAMVRGDQLCAQCHATVATGRESREIDTGVGCQRCHGPGGGYREPHETDYPGSIALGLVDLKNQASRATACANCHYVTDARLIQAGHPSGVEFQIAEAISTIKHWEHDLSGATAMQDAYAVAIATRGPVPDVTPLSLTPDVAVVASTATAGAAPEPVVGANPAREAERSGPPTTATAGARADRPVPRRPAALDFPAADPPEQLVVGPDTSTADLLRLIKRRLDDLYRLTRPPRLPGSRP
jgi:hypothetical protein